jgi:hypothetical protein
MKRHVEAFEVSDMFFSQRFRQVEEFERRLRHKCCDIHLVLGGDATLVDTYFKILRTIENRQFGCVKATLPKLFIWRRVVLIKIAWARWSFSEAIKPLIATENALWIFGEDARYNVRPQALFLKRLKGLHFPKRP